MKWLEIYLLWSAFQTFHTASPAGVESTAESSDASPSLRRFFNSSVDDLCFVSSNTFNNRDTLCASAYFAAHCVRAGNTGAPPDGRIWISLEGVRKWI